MNPWLLLLLLVLSSLNPSSSASNSISVKQPLSGTQKLISDGGKFALGFFKPGKPDYYYIGIWFNKISKQYPVWVASRDTPVTDPTTTQLKISADGNLVLSNRSNPNIWSTNIRANNTSSTTTTLAVLLDTGNLVVRNASNPNITLWQSFDHPTDTWLPGGKLGHNKVTGVSQQLTSWKSKEDPSSGLYRMELDPEGSTSQLSIKWNNSREYWTSGTWNGQIFSRMPEMTQRQKVNFYFGYVNDTTENYFTYSIKGSFISRTILDVSGQIQHQTWLFDSQEWTLIWSQPAQPCDVYSLCGPYGSCDQNVKPYCKCLRGFSEKSPTNWDLGDRSGGCARNTQLQCSRNSSEYGPADQKDKFYAMSDTGLPDPPPISVQAGSASDCEQACLNSCSCTAYSYGTSAGCSVWYGDLLDLKEQASTGGGSTLFLRLAASEIIDMSPKTNKGAVIRAVTGGAAGCLIFLVVVLVLIWRRRRGTAGKSKAVEGGLLAFRYSDLQRATNNFSEKLGGGAFGSVFKGILPDSNAAIAVKKLEGLRQGEKQFRTEVSTIGTVQHVNLVRLYGFCSHGTEKLLVYEYMPNGSLDAHLFQDGGAGATTVPDWTTRYQIALGTARGLAYLHEQCRECIIHCDIKPENVLLDACMVPKVADFGLAKLLGRDFSRVLTSMRGTIGYLAPEWIAGVAITARADVYSYGMMLFEIISGKRNSDQQGDRETKIGFFPILAATRLMEGEDAMMSLLDPRLKGEADAEEVTRACKVACWCIQDNEHSRPSMGQVVQILEGVVEVNMPPMPRTLQLLADNTGSINSL
ncbi:Uncharacterized protein M6B38_221055 [Iris pallida]|uniref:Receptor-like serine/threonine-protein kinase n=1 Tax=Iris pallida TaxID=29817 RepID=A0AAX6DYX0_IRIPA|nr:Uncharacterized protein M6B38_221055 [Iris pallida]